MKKEYNFLKANKNPYLAKSKNKTLQEKLESLANDRKKKIKQRTSTVSI